ncbi:hypothetical protein SAMN02910317_00447 [Ruminococcaceae bacterium FB2012]|nr:hypothetical protein SAMN02910317_00447 [Ruminococcaceae bacterium FB2012]
MLVTFLLALAVIAAVMLMLFSAVALVQDKRLFSTAPKDVQAAVQPKPERFKGQHLIGWKLIFLSLLMIICAAVIAVWDGVKNGFTFWQFFARFLIILYCYKAFDMVCFDWLLLTKSHFFQHYYPETEGCESYRKFGFNLRSQLIKLAVFPIVSAAAAGICMLIK